MSVEQAARKHLNESHRYEEMSRYERHAHQHRSLGDMHQQKLGMYNMDSDDGHAAHKYHSKKADLHHRIAADLEELNRHIS